MLKYDVTVIQSFKGTGFEFLIKNIHSPIIYLILIFIPNKLTFVPESKFPQICFYMRQVIMIYLSGVVMTNIHFTLETELIYFMN